MGLVEVGLVAEHGKHSVWLIDGSPEGWQGMAALAWQAKADWRWARQFFAQLGRLGGGLGDSNGGGGGCEAGCIEKRG